MKITLSKSQWEQIGSQTGWAKTAVSQDINETVKSKHPIIHNIISRMPTAGTGPQDIANTLKAKHPIIYNIISRMPGFGSALDIVENIQNNKVSAEDAGINADTINQAKQIIQSKTASTKPFDNTIIVKEALTIDTRLIAAIILVILGIAIGRSMMSDVGTMKAIPSQAEQVSEQLGVGR